MPPDEREPTGLIVVGVDGSDPSAGAARWACHQAGLSRSRIELITAWEWPLTWGPAMPFPADYDPAADALTLVDEVAEPLSREFPDIDLRTRAVKGHPAIVLVEASRHADLLVVASRGHGEFSGMLIGSVSLHCVTRAASPVLVYR